MKAFTIASGAYSELADITVPCFEWATGLTVERVPVTSDEPEAPYAQKLRLPDSEQYVFFDADLLFLRRWEVPTVDPLEFAAVPAQKYERNLRAVVDAYGGDPRKFVNTGLFIASAAHRPAMRLAAQWMGEGISCLHEESVLNCALQSTGVPVRLLKATLNQQIITNMNRTGFHLCGQRGIEAKLREARYLVRTFAPPELRKRLGLAFGPQQEHHAVS